VREEGTGRLYIVATPIGNLDDMTSRAAGALREADLILAEDTRSARILLERHGIKKRPVSCFAGNEAKRVPLLLERLDAGETVALVSESGTPAVSDPGAELVSRAVASGYPVVPFPGASSVWACLSVSGFKGRRVLFSGFLPRKDGKKRKEFLAAAGAADILVFFEHPQRIGRTLSLLADCLEDPQVVIGREMTKKYEEFLRGSASQLSEAFRETPPRGEIAVAVQLGHTGGGHDQDSDHGG